MIGFIIYETLEMSYTIIKVAYNTSYNVYNWYYSIDENDKWQNIDIIKKTMYNFIFDVLALEENNATNSDDDNKLSDAVAILIELRNQARNNKDFPTSDLIRNQLKEAGIHLKDEKDGTTFSLN